MALHYSLQAIAPRRSQWPVQGLGFRVWDKVLKAYILGLVPIFAADMPGQQGPRILLTSSPSALRIEKQKQVCAARFLLTYGGFQK